MSALLQTLLQRYSYPLLGGLLLLLILLFNAIQGVESKQHIAYLNAMEALKNSNLQYKMALFRARFTINSNFDQLLDIERDTHQQLSILAHPPRYLEPHYQVSLQQQLATLQQHFKQRITKVSQFKSAKALYSNSVRYLPELHHQIEEMALRHKNSLIDDIHQLTEALLTYIAQQQIAQQHHLADTIHHYQQQLIQELTLPKNEQTTLHRLLRHMELIINTLPSMQQYLEQASSSETSTAIQQLRDTYFSGYNAQQSTIHFSTQLLILVTFDLPLTTNDYPGGEAELTNFNREQIPVEVSRAVLHDSEFMSAYGYSYVLYDLRERKHAEEQRQFLAFQSGIAERGITVMHNIVQHHHRHRRSDTTTTADLNHTGTQQPGLQYHGNTATTDTLREGASSLSRDNSSART